MKTMRYLFILGVYTIGSFLTNSCKNPPEPLAAGLLLSLDFDSNKLKDPNQGEGVIEYSSGVAGNGIDLRRSKNLTLLKELDTEWFSDGKDFTISVWVNGANTTGDTTIIVSNADFRTRKMGIYGERRINKGFSLYSCNGGWGWNIANGKAFYNYEPITEDQPIADGKWHQLVFTYNSERREARLFHDGVNRAVLSLGDLRDVDFTTTSPVVVGSSKLSPGYGSFNGTLDNLQIWETTLSNEEIKALFKEHAQLKEEPVFTKKELTVLNWNIWHGGSHYTKEKDGFDGVERIIEMIKETDADIVLMQETYGAGSKISSSLGYHYYEASSAIGAVWGANLSVMSRYPIEQGYMNESPSNYGKNYAFNNGGAKIRLSENKRILAFSNWYNGGKPEDVEGALKGWKSLIDNADSIPHIWAGDYNSISHLDGGTGESGHSRLMTQAGFKDSYRELYPDPKKYPCITAPGFRDRIDYIYYKGKGLRLLASGTIIPDFKGRGKNPGYPSDHLGIISKFNVN